MSKKNKKKQPGKRAAVSAPAPAAPEAKPADQPSRKEAAAAAPFGSNAFTLPKTIALLLLGGLVVPVLGALLCQSLLAYIPAPLAGTGFSGVTRIAALVGGALGFVAMALLLKPLMNTNLAYLVSGKTQLNWHAVGLTAGIALIALTAAAFVCEHSYIRPGEAGLAGLLLSLLFCLVFVSLNAAGGELVFRCLLARYFFANDLPEEGPGATGLIVASGVLFLLPSLGISGVLENPSPLTISHLLCFGALGAVLMWLSLKSGSFEIAFGAHMGTSLFSYFVIAPKATTAGMLSLGSLFTSSCTLPWPLIVELLVMVAACNLYANTLQESRHGTLKPVQKRKVQWFNFNSGKPKK